MIYNSSTGAVLAMLPVLVRLSLPAEPHSKLHQPVWRQLGLLPHLTVRTQHKYKLRQMKGNLNIWHVT